jgi:hypothetical protein
LRSELVAVGNGLARTPRRRISSATLSRIVRGAEAKKLDTPIFPVSDTLAVVEHWLAGKVAGCRGDEATMIAELERAVAAEDALPYMEPTFWLVPVRPALGAALLSKGDATAAEKVFREDLKRWPRNGWGLLGLERSLRGQGRDEAARSRAPPIR